MKTKSTELGSNSTVSVVIPTFNTKDLLGKHLPRVVAAFKNPRNKIKEVIVVDDASVDGSARFVKEKFPEVRVIVHKKNRGFAASVNLGVRCAMGDLVVLLNSDVSPGEQFLERVLPHFHKPKVFAVSLHEKGYGWAKGGFRDGFIIHQPGHEGSEAANTFWVSGGSGVFRRKLWLELGGLDEKIFAPFYWEDVDLGYRALKAGYRLLWEPDSLVEHIHESTISKFSKKYRQRIQERNQLLFVWKNLSSPRLLRKHVLGLLKRTLVHPGYLRIVLMAMLKIGSVLRARRKLRKTFKISDEAIFGSF